MFNWDPKKHDEQIPKQVEITRKEIICRCGGNGFVLVHKVAIETYDNQQNINVMHPPGLLCLKCNSFTQPQDLMRTMHNVGKGAGEPPIVKTTENPQ